MMLSQILSDAASLAAMCMQGHNRNLATRDCSKVLKAVIVSTGWMKQSRLEA